MVLKILEKSQMWWNELRKNSKNNEDNKREVRTDGRLDNLSSLNCQIWTDYNRVID